MSDYYRLDFKIEPYILDAADLLAAFLADAGFESFEGKENGLSGYVQSDNFSPEIIINVVEEFPMDVNIEWKTEHIPHKDWNEEWEKKYFKPLLLADGKCIIHSSFHKGYPNADIDVTVDPKMAFGTGHHATTSMMVNFLFESNLTGKKVLDMGTGTGILAIVAKKIGAGQTIGIEIDPTAYENALENIALNRVDPIILQGDAELLKGIRGIDFFLANINRNIILADLDKYIDTLSENGTMFLSGFYLTDVPFLEEALKKYDFNILKIENVGDWAALKAVSTKG